MTSSSSPNALACQCVAATMSSWPRSRRASSWSRRVRHSTRLCTWNTSTCPPKNGERGVDLLLGRRVIRRPHLRGDDRLVTARRDRRPEDALRVAVHRRRVDERGTDVEGDVRDPLPILVDRGDVERLGGPHPDDGDLAAGERRCSIGRTIRRQPATRPGNRSDGDARRDVHGSRRAAPGEGDGDETTDVAAARWRHRCPSPCGDGMRWRRYATTPEPPPKAPPPAVGSTGTGVAAPRREPTGRATGRAGRRRVRRRSRLDGRNRGDGGPAAGRAGRARGRQPAARRERRRQRRSRRLRRRTSSASPDSASRRGRSPPPAASSCRRTAATAPRRPVRR